MERKRLKRKGYLSIVMCIAMILSLMTPGDYAKAASKPKLNASKVTIVKGNSKKIKLTASGIKSVKWSVNKTAIVKISKKTKKYAVVKAKKAGTAVLTAKVKKRSKTYKLKCKITVKKKSSSVSSSVTSTPKATATALVSATATADTSSSQTTTDPSATAVTTVTPTVTATAVATASATATVQPTAENSITTPAPTTVPDDASLDYYTSPNSGSIDYTAAAVTDTTGSQSIDLEQLSDSDYASGLSNVSVDTTTEGVTGLSIDKAGTYTLSGTLSEGYISVKKNKTVHIILDNVSVNCTESDQATLQLGKGSVVTLTLTGTNTLSETGATALTDGDDEAVIEGKKTESDTDTALYINSVDGGTLNIEAVRNNAIKVKGTVLLYNTSVSVESAANHAISAKNTLGIKDTSLTIADTAGDGIKSTDGSVYVQGGDIDITCNGDGVDAAIAAYIAPDTMDITTGTSTTEGGKGIKASTDVTGSAISSVVQIAAGTINIDSYDNAIHCGDSDNDYNYGTVYISGGTLTINSGYKNGSYIQSTTSSNEVKYGNKGIHAKNGLYITKEQYNGTDVSTNITVEHSFEGLDAQDITIMDCDSISVTAKDDGINAAGGNDSTGYDYTGTSGNNNLIINGGYINVISEGDGIDVNGNFYMYAGEVYVDGPTSDGDAALDYDGVYELCGGTLIAVGSSGMAQAPSDSSQQPSLMVTFASTQTAGSVVSIKDASGNILCSHTSLKSYQSAVMSDADMTLGGTYYVYVDDILISSVTFTSVNMQYSQSGSSSGSDTPGGTTPGQSTPGGTTPGDNSGFQNWH